ncbi:MAG: glycosyltransferase [Syntrophomonas sp.]
MNLPLVTVLMAVYNGEAYLKESIESILNQTFVDFEFLIIDDASTDNSRMLLGKYRDFRIRVVGNSQNLRLAKSLNRGIEMARGKYIARMDADDISLPQRLEKQVAFMESHPEIGVSGSWLECFGARSQVWYYPDDPGIILSNLLFQNQLGHPAVIMRRELMISKGLFYNPDYREAEDYDLWARCGEQFPLGNLPEVLLMYRWHERQASQSNLIEQRYFHGLVVRRQLERLDLHPSAQEMELHLMISFLEFDPTDSFRNASRQWLQKIMEANDYYLYYPRLELRTVLENRWRNICIISGIPHSELF